jgi:hypothetical protein
MRGFFCYYLSFQLLAFSFQLLAFSSQRLIGYLVIQLISDYIFYHKRNKGFLKDSKFLVKHQTKPTTYNLQLTTFNLQPTTLPVNSISLTLKQLLLTIKHNLLTINTIVYHLLIF